MTDAMRADNTVSLTPQGNPDARCPICQSRHQVDIFELSGVPVDTCQLWGSREKAAEAQIGDILLAFCRRCGFVFNRIYDENLVSFRPGYEASLVYSDVFRSFQREVAARLIERYGLENKTIVEIGCGHGEFLKLLCELGGNKGIGFDPTLPGEIIEPVGRGSVQLVPDYYSTAYANIEPDFVCCLSVLEDIRNPVEFLVNIKDVVGDRQPTMYFEIFNAFRAFEQRETWSIHYEQCNYFGLDSFTNLFKRCGFEIVEAGACYGEDQYLYADVIPGNETDIDGPGTARLLPIPPEVADFANHHARSTTTWRTRLADFAENHSRVVVWGSGGKGTSFLNALDTGGIIHYVVDINPNRQGQHIGGSGQQIVSPEFLTEYQPNVIVITNPLYEREIKDQVAELGLSAEYLTI